MKVTKQQLIEWANNLKTTEVEVQFDGLGGGTSSAGRGVIGYVLNMEVCEEFADGEKPGIELL